MKEHSQEWCDEMKKICDYCQHTKWFCIDHEPWKEMKSSIQWGGMNHQKLCPFYLQLTSGDSKISATAVNRYCACVVYDFCHEKDFKGYDMKCPDCTGWDIKIIKDM